MGRRVGRPVAAMASGAEERSFLERQARRRRVARGTADRCRIVPRRADGSASKAAAELGAREHAVGKRRRRFPEDRVEGPADAPRSGRPRSIGDARAAEVAGQTLEASPPDATHWSIRSMAREAGFSRATARRIRKAFGPRPHRSETSEPSSDPPFVEKARDIAGLCLPPPDRALVLRVDEKSRIRALDRTRPVSTTTVPGVPERRTHDYKRNGTTSPVAALDVATGFVVGKRCKRHRAKELLDFPEEIDAHAPEGLDVRVVMDDSATHETASVKAWLRGARAITPTPRRPRPRGPTKSSAGSPSRRASSSDGARMPPRNSSRRTSAPSSTGTTKIRNPPNGRSPPTPSSPPPSASAAASTTHREASFRFGTPEGDVPWFRITEGAHALQ